MSYRGDSQMAEWRGDVEMDVIAELTEDEGVAGASMEQTFREKTESWWNLAHQQPAYRELDATDGKEKSSAMHISSRTSNRVFNSRTQDMWDLSESVMELYESCQRRENLRSLRRDARDMIEKQESVDVQSWLAQSDETGFIRIYFPLDGPKFQHSRLIPCTIETTAQQICRILGISVSALHVQLNGDIIERLDGEQMPLLLQNNYLMTLGYESVTKVKEEGLKEDLGFLIRFYAGKPGYEGTFSRNQLNAWLEVRKGKVMQQWMHRMCVLYGTRLLLYKDKARRSDPSTLQLARGIVEQAKIKGRDLCLKLTSTLDKVKVIYLSFHDQREYEKWYTRCKKATDKLPTSADLSNCHLEFMPDNIFVNDQLTILNLRHNVLRERPSEAALFPITIGWLDDLTRFTKLRSLNLADNGLEHFPEALCSLLLLAELNLASNKFTHIPSSIGNLINLRALHLHNNHLTTLPEEMLALKKLFVLVLAFNRFASIPPVVAAMTDIRHSEMDKLILAGNQVSTLSESILASMKYVKKLDLRLNLLTLLPSETARLALVERLTHLDIRDNCISEELDLRCLAQLSYLNCERNNIMSLQLTGSALKTLLAAQNSLERLGISPQPEQLIQLDVSDNFLQALPDWLDECSGLQVLKASNNQLVDLPQRLFCDLKKLRVLHLDHNFIEALPHEIDTIFIEEIYLHSNYLTSLPPDFLRKANKLRVLNLSKNCLASLPPPAETAELNKLRELYVALNCLGDNCMDTIAAFTRLRVLHIAYNELHVLHNKDLKQLGMLEELNISANQLQSLPSAIGELPKLSVLRAHSNYLTSLPNLTKAVALRALDVGHNNLLNISFSSLFNSQLYLLDMSMNKQLRVDPKEFKTIKHTRKNVLLVDTTGQGRSLPGLKRQEAPVPPEDEQMDPSMPWKVGFAETAGSRNKLCVKLLKMVKFRNENEALFGMFDGGYNDEVPKLLVEKMPNIVAEEITHADTALEYMKYSFLSAHRQLRVSGQRLGASSALCHLKRHDSNSKQFSLQIANVGDVEAVLCRQDDAVVLTRKFTTTDNREECYRVCLSDGIIMEDGRVEGLSKCTRQIGAAFLYPHSVPEPFVCEVQLHHDDEFLIIASRTVWSHLSYGEAVEAVYEIGSPVIAAKKIQDLVQAYGCQENAAVMVIRFNTERGPTLARLRPVPRPMSVDDVEAAAQFEAARRRRQMKRAQATRAIPEERQYPSFDSHVNVSHDVYQTESQQTLTASSHVRGDDTASSIVAAPIATQQPPRQEFSAVAQSRVSSAAAAAAAGQDVVDGLSLAAKTKKEHRNLEVMKTAQVRPRVNYDQSGEGDAGSMYSHTLPSNDSHTESDAASSFAAGLSQPKERTLTKDYTAHVLHVDSSDVIVPLQPVYAARVTHSDAETNAASSLSFVAASSITDYPASTFSGAAEQPFDNYSTSAGDAMVPANAYAAERGRDIPDHAMWRNNAAAYALPSNSEASFAASSQPASYLPSMTIDRKDSLCYSDVNQEASVPSLPVQTRPLANESDKLLAGKNSSASLPRSSNNSITAGTKSAAYKSPPQPAVPPKSNTSPAKDKELPARNGLDESASPVPFNVILKPLSTHRFVRRDDVNRWNTLLQGNRSEEVKTFEHRQAEIESRTDRPAASQSNKFASGSVSRGTSQGFLQYMQQQQSNANQQQPAIVVSPTVDRHAIRRQVSEDETDSSLLNVKATIHLFEHISSRESLMKVDDDDTSAQALLAKPPPVPASNTKRAKSETRDPHNATGGSYNEAASLLHRSPSDQNSQYYQLSRGRYSSNSRAITPTPSSPMYGREGSRPVATHSRTQSATETQTYVASSTPSYTRHVSDETSVKGRHDPNTPNPNTIREQLEARSRATNGEPLAAAGPSRRPPTYPPPPLPESTARPPLAAGAATVAPSLAFHYEQLQYGSRSGDNVYSATESDNSINAVQRGNMQPKPRGNVEIRAASNANPVQPYQPQQPSAGYNSEFSSGANRNRRPSQPVQSSTVRNSEPEFVSVRRSDASADGQSSYVKSAAGERVVNENILSRPAPEKASANSSQYSASSTMSSEKPFRTSSSENSIGRMGKVNSAMATAGSKPGTNSVGRSWVPNIETEELYSTVNRVRRRMDSANVGETTDEAKRFTNDNNAAWNKNTDSNSRYSAGNQSAEYGSRARPLLPSQPTNRNSRDVSSYNQPRQYAPLPITNSDSDEFVEHFSRL